MNDARMSVEQIAYERGREKEVLATLAQALVQEGATLGRPRGVLTAEAAAARQALRTEAAAQETVRTVVPSHAAPQVEPPRFERPAVLAIFILIMGFIWIRLKKSRHL